MEEGGGRERWVGSSSPVSILGAGCRSRAFVFVHGPWPSTGGRVVVPGHSMFVGGSWSSVGAPCSWVGCRGHQWRVVRGHSTLVGGGLLSSIGVSAVWCRVCGQSRSSVVRLWQSSGRVVVRGVVVVCGTQCSRIGCGRQWGGRPWALDVCRWVAVVYGGVVHVVCHLWVVVVIQGGSCSSAWERWWLFVGSCGYPCV